MRARQEVVADALKGEIGHTCAPHRRSITLLNWKAHAPHAIAIGVNPPDDVNVVIEVPIGGPLVR
jgi:hypothetical protein